MIRTERQRAGYDVNISALCHYLILVKRLCREAKIWAALEDAHILPLLGLTWGFGPLPAMVCPWVENGTLNGYLEKHNDLSMARRFHIVST